MTGQARSKSRAPSLATCGGRWAAAANSFAHHCCSSASPYLRVVRVDHLAALHISGGGRIARLPSLEQLPLLSPIVARLRHVLHGAHGEIGEIDLGRDGEIGTVGNTERQPKIKPNDEEAAPPSFNYLSARLCFCQFDVPLRQITWRL